MTSRKSIEPTCFYDDIDEILKRYDDIEQRHLYGPLEKEPVLRIKTKRRLEKPPEKFHDKPLEGSLDKPKPSRLTIAAICLTMATIIIIIISSVTILPQALDLTALRREHTSLLRLAETLLLMELSEEVPSGLPEEISEILESIPPYINIFDAGMRAINPDYIAWIIIDGTVVNYPVVRGSDNERYLNTSFYGEPNIFGTLFMDYRNVGEYVPHIIIYGHNIRSGEMFGSLHNFLNEEYLAEHSIITLIVNGRLVEYKIFAARKTDINDPAYFLDFSAPGSFSAFLERNGAPPDAAQIITLSTCVSRGDDDERLVVQGALISTPAAYADDFSESMQ